MPTLSWIHQEVSQEACMISWHVYLPLNYNLLKGNNYVVPGGPGAMADLPAFYMYSCWLQTRLPFLPSFQPQFAALSWLLKSSLHSQGWRTLAFSQDSSPILASFTDTSCFIVSQAQGPGCQNWEPQFIIASDWHLETASAHSWSAQNKSQGQREYQWLSWGYSSPMELANCGLLSLLLS